MSTVISVEALGKKYLLNHHAQRQPYVALRDVITEQVAALGRKLLHPLHSSTSAPHPSQEEFWALREVSFEVKQGDRVGIVGRNGAGKSTLLKILSRITEPSTGSVRIKGRVASLLEVGTGFHPELTGRENIFLNGAILGMGRVEIRKKFDEIVDFAEIEKFLDTPVKRYSSGMYVRLAFAVAAHLDPEILIIDEVLAVGDAHFQKKCLGKMEDASTKEGRTVLFVSHNMAAINQMSQFGIWLEKGSIRGIGQVNEVVERYVSNGAISEGEKIWSRRYDDLSTNRIQFNAVRIRNQEGKISSLLDMSNHFFVEIEYEIITPCKGIRIGFWVYTQDGILIFVSADNNNDKWYGIKRDCGRYLSICKVPGMLLNSGSYSLTIAADIPSTEIVYVEHHALSFRLEHTGFSEHDGIHKSPGIISPPNLEWEISIRE